MTKQQNDNYKGYFVVTGPSGGSSPPYTASFGVALVQPDGTCGEVENHICDATYQTEEDAGAAAYVAACKFIDLKMEKK